MGLRIRRLVRGEFDPEDFTHLFMYLRDRCDGRESVLEVGDFVPHRNERTKGIVTRTPRDLFLIAGYKLETLGKPIALDCVPPNFTDVLFRNVA